jgi:hypothetical protein
MMTRALSAVRRKLYNMLWILDANTLADKKPPVLIAGNADNGGGGIANGFTTPGVITAAAAAASLVPAFRATRVDPIVALKDE